MIRIMDELSIERVWEDVDFFEIEIVAQSKFIRASTKSYTTVDSINKLASQLVNFPRSFSDRYIWENGIKGEGWTPYISLEFWNEDKLGHIVIEVYMELGDTASRNHNCCFLIKTEVGLLNNFGKSLYLLNEQGIGTKIVL